MARTEHVTQGNMTTEEWETWINQRIAGQNRQINRGPTLVEGVAYHLPGAMSSLRDAGPALRQVASGIYNRGARGIVEGSAGLAQVAGDSVARSAEALWSGADGGTDGAVQQPPRQNSAALQGEPLPGGGAAPAQEWRNSTMKGYHVNRVRSLAPNADGEDRIFALGASNEKFGERHVLNANGEIMPLSAIKELHNITRQAEAQREVARIREASRAGAAPNGAAGSRAAANGNPLTAKDMLLRRQAQLDNGSIDRFGERRNTTEAKFNRLLEQRASMTNPKAVFARKFDKAVRNGKLSKEMASLTRLADSEDRKAVKMAALEDKQRDRELTALRKKSADQAAQITAILGTPGARAAVKAEEIIRLSGMGAGVEAQTFKSYFDSLGTGEEGDAKRKIVVAELALHLQKEAAGIVDIGTGLKYIRDLVAGA